MISEDYKLTECQICFERYNKANKEPKVLSCGHTFCKECLIKALKKVEEIKCFICRAKQSEKDVEKYPPNRLVYDLLYQPIIEIKDEKDKQAFKVILIGPENAGKTSLIYKKINDKCVNYDYKKIKIENQLLKLQIWDTAGTEMFQSMMPSIIRNSHVAIVVFDITNKKSLEDCKYWIDIYRQYQSKETKELIYLIGNKIDLPKENQVVSTKDGENYCLDNKLRKYFEISAKTGQNVDDLFINIAKDLIDIDFKDNSNIKKCKIISNYQIINKTIKYIIET